MFLARTKKRTLNSNRDPVPLGKRSPAQRQGYLAVVAIARNEAPYLKEWLAFQRLVGVEHVYLYDNASEDETAAVLAPHADFVTYIPWGNFVAGPSVQSLAFAHALCTFGARWRWVAVIDIDEFLFPAQGDSLAAVLRDYEDLPAVSVPWHVFTHSGRMRRPDGLVIESYTERAAFPPEDRALFKWKSIVNPARVVAVDGPHLFVFDEGTEIGGYDEDRNPILRANERIWDVSARRFRLNHYFTKSEEEFETKLERGYQWLKRTRPDSAERKLHIRNEALRRTVQDETILRFVPALKAALTD
jgi:hypothetical protein